MLTQHPAPKPAREPREHGRDLLRVVQLRRPLHRGAGCAGAGSIVDVVKGTRQVPDGHGYRLGRWCHTRHPGGRGVCHWVVDQVDSHRRP